MLRSAWTVQRCWIAPGQSSCVAFQIPGAPSAMTSAGARILRTWRLEFPRFCGVLSTCGESAAVRMDIDAEDEACLSGVVPAGGVGVGPSGPLDPGRGREPGGDAADAAQLAPPGGA